MALKRINKELTDLGRYVYVPEMRTVVGHETGLAAQSDNYLCGHNTDNLL